MRVKRDKCKNASHRPQGANRNGPLAALCRFLALWLHDHWRREKRALGVFYRVLRLLLGLLSHVLPYLLNELDLRREMRAFQVRWDAVCVGRGDRENVVEKLLKKQIFQSIMLYCLFNS